MNAILTFRLNYDVIKISKTQLSNKEMSLNGIVAAAPSQQQAEQFEEARV